ncbi:MAG: VWA domain-containing protein [bacterium]
MAFSTVYHKGKKNPFTIRLIHFANLLRGFGFEVSSTQLLDVLAALNCLDVCNYQDVYQAFNCIFTVRRGQSAIFKRLYDFFWGTEFELPLNAVLPRAPKTPAATDSLNSAYDFWQGLLEGIDTAASQKQTPLPDEGKKVDFLQTYSAIEILRKKDFAAYSEEDLDLAKKLITQMPWLMPTRRSRRLKKHSREHLLDLRQTIRQGLRHQGELLSLRWRGHKTRPVPLVILCDVSGSMQRYSRLFLHFMHILTGRQYIVESFVFGTRLTRITRSLQQHDIDSALTSVSSEVLDWAGGTRIGAALKEFNFRWARRVLRSRAVVVIISDGWDRGDIPLLEREMARLARSCGRILWLNPLSGHKEFEPLTRGLQAALPFIDEFLPLDNLESLQQIGRALNR